MSHPGDYVTANGVRTYYEVDGEGAPLLLLHGGLSPIETFAAQRAALSAKYRVYLPERRGHGRTADVDGPLTYELMADDTIAFMEAMSIERAHIAGWSDGGNIGLIMALRRPAMVRTLAVIGANFHFEGLAGDFRAHVAEMTPETFVAPLVQLYGALSPDGPEHFAVVLERVKQMWLTGPTLTPGNLASIAAATLVIVGDRDLPTLEHTIELYRAVPNAQLYIVPGASHMVMMEKAEAVNRALLEFLAAADQDGG